MVPHDLNARLAATLAALLVAGCAATSEQAPPLSLVLSLDKAEYKIGDPLIATVVLRNDAARTVEVPRFDQDALKFITAQKGPNLLICKEPVYSGEVMPEPRQLKPGESISRPLVFTRATDSQGEYALMATFKGALLDGALINDAVHAAAIPFRVTSEVGLRRDPANGLILEEQAIEIAKLKAPGEVKETRAVLAPLGQSGLFTWVILLRVAMPDGKELRYSVQVDPYVGRLRPIEFKPAEKAPAETK